MQQSSKWCGRCLLLLRLPLLCNPAKQHLQQSSLQLKVLLLLRLLCTRRLSFQMLTWACRLPGGRGEAGQGLGMAVWAGLPYACMGLCGALCCGTMRRGCGCTGGTSHTTPGGGG
jgi:hypothetical protein